MSVWMILYIVAMAGCCLGILWSSIQIDREIDEARDWAAHEEQLDRLWNEGDA
jgi:hypothetical protein